MTTQEQLLSDPTVDAREVAFYENLSAFWWDRQGPFWPLHRLNELRVAWIRARLSERMGRDPAHPRPLDGLEVLDIGCGGGILSESMAGLGARVTGIDVVEKNIRIAAIHAEQQRLRIDYRTCTAESLASQGARYDVVLNMEVVEHVADVSAFMDTCNRLVAPRGAQFVATINRTPLAWLFAIVGAEYVLRWLPRGTHRWGAFRKPSEMARLLERGGLAIAARSGVSVNPLSRGFRLTPRMSVNYMLMATRD